MLQRGDGGGGAAHQELDDLLCELVQVWADQVNVCKEGAEMRQERLQVGCQPGHVWSNGVKVPATVQRAAPSVLALLQSSPSAASPAPRPTHATALPSPSRLIPRSSCN